MKQRIFLIMITLVSFTACKKKDCWKCTAEEVGGAASILPGSKSVSDSTVCGKTEEEIRKYEQEKTGTFTYEEAGQTHTLVSKVTCN
jgi:hypothetical protein